MLVTGIDSVCIVAASDTHLALPIWLDEVLPDGKYQSPYDGTQLWNDNYFNTVKKHTFKFHTGDTSQFAQIETWAEANTPVFIYTFGIDGGIQWEEGSVIRPNRDRSNKSLDTDYMEIQVATSGLGLNVQARKNLLPSPVSTGISITDFTLDSGITFISTTPNAGFTSAVGNAFRLTNTSGSFGYLKATYNRKFPARKGHPVSLFASVFAGSGNDVGTPGIILTGYSGTGVSTESFALTNDYFSHGIMKGSYVFTNASTRYFKISFATNEPTSVNEFDSIALTYGPQILKFIDF